MHYYLAFGCVMSNVAALINVGNQPPRGSRGLLPLKDSGCLPPRRSLGIRKHFSPKMPISIHITGSAYIAYNLVAKLMSLWDKKENADAYARTG